ncbi:uncharacterized protein LOC119837223 [Zerene cesonia]|uniref:uncharacterized protein LOC119837223 n=1 Tax=Zerene cesonia TaxID=33412 RepID=UPI0018E50AEA|nr:uncharacterized protein LOC119837223 [Zerene cesonia]
MEYCSHLWDGFAKYQLETLEAIERRAKKLINDGDLVGKRLQSLAHRRRVASLWWTFHVPGRVQQAKEQVGQLPLGATTEKCCKSAGGVSADSRHSAQTAPAASGAARTPNVSTRLDNTLARRRADSPTRRHADTPPRYRNGVVDAMKAIITLVVCLCAAWSVESSAAPRGFRRRPQPAAEYEEYERNNLAPVQPQVSPALSWQPISVNIPIPRGAGSSVPLVILPLPMPVAAPTPTQTECKVVQETKYEYENDEDGYEAPQAKPVRPSQPSRPGLRRPERPQSPAWGPIVAEESEQPPPHAPPTPPAPQPYPSYVRPEELDSTVTIPHIETPFTSQQLVQLFREQAPRAPALPPLLLSEHDRSERQAAGPPPAPAGPTPLASARPRSARSSYPRPPKPRIARSLAISADLTVPRADYTETYTAWYDAESGSARVDFFDGSSSSYRTFMPDGRVQYLEVRVDRSGERPVRRCGRSEPQPAAPADRRPPALPDFAQFTFAGYVEQGNASLERWQQQVAGAAGELGAARGERLTARHDLLLARDRDDQPVPLQYNVAVDSSVLGSDCDGYQHRYVDVRNEQKDAAFFTPNIDELCDTVEMLNRSEPEHFARLDPLREFTLPFRDPKYDAALQKFKTDFNRKYGDDIEEAVRKNLLMQNTRFTSSGNRQGGTSQLGINYLGERLDAELQLLMGVEPSGRDSAERFPHSRRQLQKMDSRLPDRFDWRPRGGVSPVQFQGANCASCWAFAVAGAVEGALFARTRRLVPLSPQCLVDCAHPYGGRGCGGTWPSHAYNYVQERGLPALDEYTPYKEKVEQCRDKEVPAVTRISGHVNVTENSVPALKVAIKEHAPSVVLVDANAKSFVFHKSGVLYDDRCGKTLKKLKHAVLAVGWGSSKGEPYFVLKNSWSAAWGERGYVRVQARSNTCGVLTKPSYPRLAPADVLRRDLPQP